MLTKVKALCKGIGIAGDGRHDSMGHSAKYGAYTIFCCTVPMIIHSQNACTVKLLQPRPPIVLVLQPYMAECEKRKKSLSGLDLSCKLY